MLDRATTIIVAFSGATAVASRTATITDAPLARPAVWSELIPRRPLPPAAAAAHQRDTHRREPPAGIAAGGPPRPLAGWGHWEGGRPGRRVPRGERCEASG